ncbi:hypothetical protein [Telluribacter humicola]|uniref:hypothetical protein n=1 Tax=Telluribacter humicola TaxID=1720261 RepID=UPI001A973715|nr:hypothetical protein [Telluribacter humicola]
MNSDSLQSIRERMQARTLRMKELVVSNSLSSLQELQAAQRADQLMYEKLLQSLNHA